MSVAVMKYFSRYRPRTLRSHLLNSLRTSTNEPCPPKSDSRPPKCESSAPKPPKPDPCQTCPEPPPCPPMPQCPPSVCPPIIDPSNPCNYCPPPCIDPEYPDLTKLKERQCQFQQDSHIPMYLRGGKMSAYSYHLAVVLTFISVTLALVNTFKCAKKQ